MNIVHLTSSFYPDSTGGTETYVFQLASNQLAAGEKVTVLRLGDMPNYQYSDLNVHVVSRELVKKPAYYGGLKQAETIVNQVVKVQPDVVYVHDRNPHFSAETIDAIKKQLPNCKFTGVYHSPGQSCPNRSLINQYQNICDGELITKRCTECRISKTKGAFLGKLLAKYSAEQAFFGSNGLEEISHANYFTNKYIAAFKKWINALDFIQYHADWVKDLLILNGVETEKLLFFPLESIYNFQKPTKTKKTLCSSDKIQLVCSGRCTNIKGQLLFLEALENLKPSIQQKIDVHFIGPGFDDDTLYAKNVRQKIESLDFVHSPQLLKPDSVQAFLVDKHIGVVPSLWPETGPLVSLDFLSAGMKVISTPYTGIKNSAMAFFNYGDVQSLANEIEAQVLNYSHE